MIEIDRILCPVDLSEHSRHALDHAVAFARWYDASITALHVNPLEAAAAAFPPTLPTVEPLSVEAIAEEVTAFSEAALLQAPAAAILVRDGNPVAEIVAQAEQLEADLLVLGTHGRGGFERLLLGSVAEKVLRKVRCPVLTVPPRSRPDAAPVQFKTILCAVDFSDASVRALEYALSLAEESDARLVLLHVVEVGELALAGDAASLTVPEYLGHLEEDAGRRLRAAIPDEAREWCTPEETVSTGRADREIMRVADERRADLIVMGVHGRAGLEAALFGSTAQHVVRAASCPVLTLRTP